MKVPTSSLVGLMPLPEPADNRKTISELHFPKNWEMLALENVAGSLIVSTDISGRTAATGEGWEMARTNKGRV